MILLSKPEKIQKMWEAAPLIYKILKNAKLTEEELNESGSMIKELIYPTIIENIRKNFILYLETLDRNNLSDGLDPKKKTLVHYFIQIFKNLISVENESIARSSIIVTLFELSDYKSELINTIEESFILEMYFIFSTIHGDIPESICKKWAPKAETKDQKKFKQNPIKHLDLNNMKKTVKEIKTFSQDIDIWIYCKDKFFNNKKNFLNSLETLLKIKTVKEIKIITDSLESLPHDYLMDLKKIYARNQFMQQKNLSLYLTLSKPDDLDSGFMNTISFLQSMGMKIVNLLSIDSIKLIPEKIFNLFKKLENLNIQTKPQLFFSSQKSEIKHSFTLGRLVQFMKENFNLLKNPAPEDSMILFLSEEDNSFVINRDQIQLAMILSNGGRIYKISGMESEIKGRPMNSFKDESLFNDKIKSCKICKDTELYDLWMDSILSLN